MTRVPGLAQDDTSPPDANPRTRNRPAAGTHSAERGGVMISKLMAVGVVGLGAVGCLSSVVDESRPGSGGSGGSGAGASASSGTGGACAAFDDEDGTASVTVHFRNDSPMTVYLPVSCGAVTYTIVPVGGSDGLSYTFDGSCLQTCEALQSGPPASCGACMEQTYLIPPGGSRDVVWKGTALQHDVAMPEACFGFDAPSGTCNRVVAAGAGTYRVEVTGYGSCGGGECLCSEDGTCSGTATGLTAWADPAKFDFPAAAEVDVVFGICAFGCAGD